MVAGKIKSFTDLEAWQQAHKLRVAILLAIRDFPVEYRFGLSDQMQRAAISVSSNIAESFGRRTIKEKLRFYDISRGSMTELQDQMIAAKDIDVISSSEFDKLASQSIRVHKLIHGLMRSLRAASHESRDTNVK